jgi:hypothetical protein
LFFEQFALSGNVAAVAFGDDVFAHCFDGFAGDDLLPMAAWMATSNIWRGMSSFIFAVDDSAFGVGGFAVQNQGERVNLFAGTR